MFGNNFNQKGMLFIIDFILVVVIVVFALMFFANIKQEKSIKLQNDLVYQEASAFFGSISNNTISKSNEYFCNSFYVNRIVNNTLTNDKKEVCTSIFK